MVRADEGRTGCRAEGRWAVSVNDACSRATIASSSRTVPLNVPQGKQRDEHERVATCAPAVSPNCSVRCFRCHHERRTRRRQLSPMTVTASLVRAAHGVHCSAARWMRTLDRIGTTARRPIRATPIVCENTRPYLRGLGGVKIPALCMQAFHASPRRKMLRPGIW